MKNTFKLLAMLVIAWIWLPTSPMDILFIPWIISHIGFTGYMIVSIFLVWWLYRSIKGRTIIDKLKEVHREIKQLL
jgi:membrane protein implicated in regulation of membrane protease activity